MDISIIVVNWNSADYTKQCVSSIRAFTDDSEYEILVVDNASSDDSVEVLQSLPGIRLIRSPENLGFARANNLGAQQSSGRVLLFLNPDTKLVGPAINRMYTALVSSTSVGIVGCKLLNADLTLQTSCIQPFPTILNQVTDIERLKRAFPQVRMWGIGPLFKDSGDQPAAVEAVSGACLMIRREVFEQVRMFSMDYFMYGEDIDLCYKVRQSGWTVGYVADATIVHYAGQSTKKRKNTSFGDVVTMESIHTFLKKTRGALYAQAYRACLGIISILRLGVLIVAFVVPLIRVDRDYLRSAIRKWRSVFYWSLGLEQWAKRLRVNQPKITEIQN